MNPGRALQSEPRWSAPTNESRSGFLFVPLCSCSSILSLNSPQKLFGETITKYRDGGLVEFAKNKERYNVLDLSHSDIKECGGLLAPFPYTPFWNSFDRLVRLSIQFGLLRHAPGGLSKELSFVVGLK
eukprot:1369763-Amphidinium_carterae.1